MHTDKKYYFLKLNPPRSTFARDMTQEERNIMHQHVAYWTDLMNKGFVIVFGPVSDPKGVYGIGIVVVDNPEQVTEFIANDPANGLNKYEYYSMMAVTPDKSF